MGPRTVAAVHTAMSMVEPTKELFAKHLPGVRLINITDDSLIQDVVTEVAVPESVMERLLGYYRSAVLAGADLIFNTCSSVGDIAINARGALGVPIVKIDDAMAKIAVESASRIGVLATLPSTLDPTVRLLKSFAAGRNIEIIEGLAEGAYEALRSGDILKHDRLILDTAEKIVDRVELFVLAQGSMARMEKQLENHTGKKVLSSPESGVLMVREVLQKL